MQVSADLGSSWNEVISQHEIALFGGLCGLAHFDRSELGRHIISNPGFREHLEVCPEVPSFNQFNIAPDPLMKDIQSFAPLIKLLFEQWQAFLRSVCLLNCYFDLFPTCR